MPKILHSLEDQPTANRLVFFIANPSQFSPLPLKANNGFRGVHYYQVCFQSEEFIT